MRQRAGALGEQCPLTEHPSRALAKRILRHQDELFQYVRHPGAPADTNAAEGALRPLVIMRKISGSPRSAPGSQTRLTLFSLVSTWTARGLNPFFHYLDLLQSAAPPRTSFTLTLNSYVVKKLLSGDKSAAQLATALGHDTRAEGVFGRGNEGYLWVEPFPVPGHCHSRLLVYEGVGHSTRWEVPERLASDPVGFVGTMVD